MHAALGSLHTILANGSLNPGSALLRNMTRGHGERLAAHTLAKRDLPLTQHFR